MEPPYDLAGLVAGRRRSCRPRWLRRGDGSGVDAGKLGWTLLDDDPELVVSAARRGRGGHARAARPRPPSPPRLPPASTSTTTPGLEQRPPRVTTATRPPGPAPRADARAPPRARARRAPTSTASSTSRRPPAAVDGGDARRARSLLGGAGRGRRGRAGGLRVPAGGRSPRGAGGGARARAGPGGRRVPLVPGRRGRGPAGHGVAGGSDESALILTGVARFLAAHTPTRASWRPCADAAPAPGRGALRRRLNQLGRRRPGRAVAAAAGRSGTRTAGRPRARAACG